MGSQKKVRSQDAWLLGSYMIRRLCCEWFHRKKDALEKATCASTVSTACEGREGKGYIAVPACGGSLAEGGFRRLH
eukprot:1154628-Pelagomonas_calceolata.AAC.1